MSLSQKALAALNKIKTAKQRKFAIALAEKNNKTQAAIAAGYAPTNAGIQGSAMAKNPLIREAVQALREDFAEDAGVKAIDVMNRLNNLSKANIGDVIEWEKNGEVSMASSSKELSIDVLRQIKSVSSKPVTDNEGNIVGYDTKVVMHDSVKATHLLGQAMGLFDNYQMALQTLKLYGELTPSKNGGFNFCPGQLPSANPVDADVEILDAVD